jgi:hypothetical protein
VIGALAPAGTGSVQNPRLETSIVTDALGLLLAIAVCAASVWREFLDCGCTAIPVRGAAGRILPGA